MGQSRRDDGMRAKLIHEGRRASGPTLRGPLRELQSGGKQE